MIGYIKGKATVVSKEFCFIEAGGIGYRVFISEMSRQKIHLGAPVRLLTYMAVREDAILLYGFLTQEEYDLFLILISVSKIGPKVAMGILSVMEPVDFVLSIRNRNLSVLTKLPGVGKKTAERLLVELKDKVGDFAEGDMIVVIGGVWKDTCGVITAMNHNKQTVTINVDLFGRETPVEVSFADVKKMN